MSKTRSFLASVTVAVAALTGISKADAAPTNNSTPMLDSNSEKSAVAVFELPEFLVITRSQQSGELMAYHSSHRSHSSHSSHQSHYSSR